MQGDAFFANGTVTLPSATSTFANSLTTTGGSIVANGGVMEFVAGDSGNNVSFNGSEVNEVRFTGIGSWSMSDTNATTTSDFVIESGSVSLPGGRLAVGGNLITEGSLSHNNGLVSLYANAGTSTLSTNSNDLYGLAVVGAGVYETVDENLTLLDDLTIENGVFIAPTSTLSIGGSLTATAGTFVANDGSVLFNSLDTG